MRHPIWPTPKKIMAKYELWRLMVQVVTGAGAPTMVLCTASVPRECTEMDVSSGVGIFLKIIFQPVITRAYVLIPRSGVYKECVVSITYSSSLIFSTI